MSDKHSGDGGDGHDSDRLATLLAAIAEAEERQTAALEEQNHLARQRTETTSHLASYSSRTAEQAEKQTGLALERTALTREQTRLSTRTSELANIRTELARERTFNAEERTRLATRRTEMARRRTAYSELRTKLAEQRNDLARQRTFAAISRTRLSLERTELAKGRTNLALIRTGLAFLTLGITLFRLLGFSTWSLFDGALVVISVLMIYYGVIGYRRTRTVEVKIMSLLAGDCVIADCFAPPSQCPDSGARPSPPIDVWGTGSMAEKANCWQIMKCGREAGGSNVAEFGVCPAAVGGWSGMNGGANAGRICWAVAGTLCGGKVQGTFAQKAANCMNCEFYLRVCREESSSFHLRPER